MTKPLLTLVALGALALAGSTSAHAQALLLNFGNSNALNPALNTAANNPAGIAGGTFNTVLGDTTSGLVYSDGLAAPITLDLGYIQLSGGNYVFNAGAGTPTIFNAAGTGIYAAGAPASNSLFEGSGSGPGMVVNGLAAGSYTVYVVGVRVAAGTGSVPQTDYSQAITTPATFNSMVPFNVNSFTNATQLNGANYSPTAFSLGNNYQSFTTTVGAGQSLFVGSFNSTSSTSFLNIVEIVAVPEPSTWAMAGIGCLMILAKVLHKRRARA